MIPPWEMVLHVGAIHELFDLHRGKNHTGITFHSATVDLNGLPLFPYSTSAA